MNTLYLHNGSYWTIANGLLLIIFAILLVAIPYMFPGLNQAMAGLGVLAGMLGLAGINILLSGLFRGNSDQP